MKKIEELNNIMLPLKNPCANERSRIWLTPSYLEKSTSPVLLKA
jgi:hypothetical protein